MHLLPVWAREDRERGVPRQVGEPERVVPPPPHPAPHRTPLNWPAVPRIELGRPEWLGWLNFDRPGLADLPAGRPSIQIASLERGFVGEEPLSSRAVASGHPRPPRRVRRRGGLVATEAAPSARRGRCGGVGALACGTSGWPVVAGPALSSEGGLQPKIAANERKNPGISIRTTRHVVHDRCSEMATECHL